MKTDSILQAGSGHVDPPIKGSLEIMGVVQ
jgi:hypothetical protein